MNRWVTLALAALIVVVQADLWFGKGSLPYVWSLQRDLDQQLAANRAASERNARTAAEVSGSITSVAAAADEMNASIKEIAQNATQAAQVAGEALRRVHEAASRPRDSEARRLTARTRIPATRTLGA